VRVDTVEVGEDAVEVADDEERCSQRGQEREKGSGEEECAICGLSRGVESEEADSVGVEGEIKAKNAAGFFAVRSDELGDVGERRRGTKDDKDATCVAGTRNMKELGTGPDSARARLPPKKVLWVFGDLRLRDDDPVKVGLPKPGDQLDELVAGETTSIDCHET